MLPKAKYKFLLLMLIFSLQSHAFLGDGGAGWAQLPYLIKILEGNYNHSNSKTPRDARYCRMYRNDRRYGLSETNRRTNY